jgi:heat shock protein HslJ
MKKNILLALGIFLIVVGIFLFSFIKTSSPFADVRDITYLIEGQSVTLTGGVATIPVAPGSASKVTVQLFGEPVYGDLNGDGDATDAAVTLVTNTSGSGTFYYAVLAIKKGEIYHTTNAILLGDRIAPQTVELTKGQAIYNYAERNTGEPMTTPPSIGKSLFVKYDTKTNTIEELVQNFEIQTNPSKMKLTTKTWEWVKTETASGAVILPKRARAFSLTFDEKGRINVKTDCNSIGGSYTVKDSTITLKGMASTMMACVDSQEQLFSSVFNTVTKFTFTSKGELIFTTKNKKETMTFR